MLPRSQSSILTSGGLSPVIITTLSPSLSTRFKNDACCSTRGLVGAKKRTLPLSILARRTIRAITVLPRPVGTTIRLEASRA